MSAGVVRCTVSERAPHWAFATGYLLLLASGLPLMTPALQGLTASLHLITGVALWPFGADRLWRAAHRWLTVLVLTPIASHIFLAAGHPSTRHALTGMLDGRVDREWVATHHPRWGPQ